MRVALALLACAAFATAQSHPSWWTDASPGATALVGVNWQSVRASPFADPVAAELWGDLGFPNLPCLQNAREIILSSPDFLALASGNFPDAALVEQGAGENMNAMTYRGVEMWFATAKGVLSVARLSDQVVMIGDPKTLQAAVDRRLTDTRDYSPLLARAAQFSDKDLWVVSSQLPDDLASRFVPLDTDAESFAGSLSVSDGLDMSAVLSVASAKEAGASAEKLRKAIPSLPLIARGLQVDADDDSIFLNLAASRAQLIAALRGPDPVVEPVPTVKVESPARIAQMPVEKPVEVSRKVVEKQAEKVVEKPVQKPQVVRILGLEGGPREIVLPPVKNL